MICFARIYVFVALLCVAPTAFAAAVNQDGSGYTLPDTGDADAGGASENHADTFDMDIYDADDVHRSTDVCHDEDIDESAVETQIAAALDEDLEGREDTFTIYDLVIDDVGASFECRTYDSPEFEDCTEDASDDYSQCTEIDSQGKIGPWSDIIGCYNAYEDDLAACDDAYGDDFYYESYVRVDASFWINNTEGTFSIVGNVTDSRVGGRAQRCLTSLAVSNWEHDHLVSGAAKNWLSNFLAESAICW